MTKYYKGRKEPVTLKEMLVDFLKDTKELRTEWTYLHDDSIERDPTFQDFINWVNENLD